MASKITFLGDIKMFVHPLQLILSIPKVSFVIQSTALCSSTRATHWVCFLVGRVGMPGYGTMSTVPLLSGPSQWLTGKCSQRPVCCAVRECVANHMSELCIFHLALFSLLCRHVGDDKGRTHELEQSAVKCMRGILFCYMRQSEKVFLLQF